MRRRAFILATAIGSLAVLLCCATVAPAVTYTWTGGDVDDDLWTSGDNWGGTAPGNVNSDDIRMAGTTRLTPVVDTNDPWTLNTLYFNSGADSFTISGNAITFGGSASTTIQNSSGKTQTIDNDLSIKNVVNASSGSIVLNGDVTLLGTLTARGGGNVTINGKISGSYSVSRTDPGTLYLTNADNDFTGGVTVSHGILSVASIADAGVASAIGAGSTIGLGQGTWGPSDTGTLRYTGSTASTNRTVQMRSNNIYGNGGVGSGLSGRPTIEVTDPNTTLTFNGNFEYASGSTYGIGWYLKGAGNGIINGNITTTDTTMGVTKQGTGTWTLNGNNTYGGITTVQAGTLKIGNVNALGATGSGNGTVINSGATLDLGGAYSSANSAEEITVSGTGVNGLGAIINTGSAIVNRGFGNVTLAGDTTFGGSVRWDLRGGTTVTGNNYTLTKAGTFQMAVSGAINDADIVIDAGSITIQNSNALGGATYGTTTINAGGTLNYYGAYTVPETIIMNGGTLGSLNNDATFSGPLTLNAAVVMSTASGGHDMTISGVIDGSGGFTKTGGSTLILTQSANSYSGGTTVDAGVLELYGANDGQSTVGLGDLTINSGGTVTGVSHNVLGHTDAANIPHVVVNGGTLNPPEYLQVKSIEMTGGTITASGGTSGSGLDWLHAPSTLTSHASGTSATVAAKSTITGTFTVAVEDGGAADDLVISGEIVGSGLLNKTGDGVLRLNAANTYTGGTTVDGGTLRLGSGG